MRFKWIVLFSLCSSLHAENPWGKDVDLIDFRINTSTQETPEPTFLKRLGTILINFHQDVISPIDGPRSNFYPSSSQYTKESIQKHGFFTGVMLGCDRLLRENDDAWVYQTCIAPDGRKLKMNLVPTP
jgi:hypothetical protein